MKKFSLKGIFFIIFLCSAIFLVLFFLKPNFRNGTQSPAPIVKINNTADPKITPPIEPISNALSRVTKKPFGIYVTPKNSPIQPERFTGFHTGTDFETLLSEQNLNVPIYAICHGPLILKKSASGYGGVAVQACKINGSDVTVIYGHLKLSSIIFKINDQIKTGEQIAVLGKGYSTETDGERKHLHLAIHKSTSVNLLGYVQNKSELNGWIDPINLLK